MMSQGQSSKKIRQKKLKEFLKKNPFLTDDDLAEIFGVSVQTIRLDRLALGIPEVRKRIKSVAEEAFGKVRSLAEGELVGRLLDIKLGQYAISAMDITKEMVSEHGHVRGHVLYAQASSLAIAVIDSEIVLTGSARVRFKRPVLLGERVIATATVKTRKGASYLVSVHSKVNNDLVFKGHFIMFAPEKKKQ
ncbi:MAG: Regulatory protein DeoR [Clostridia bacterium 41_269]|nr:MAG: Regulatory protein DeoR [Clostridia bacterium 41_269]